VSDILTDILDREPALAGETPIASILSSLQAAREATHEQIRELVLVHRRFDILAKHVLGYDPQDFHLEMMQWQEETDEGLMLGFRGAAKTTYCTITRAIGEILCDGNIRILFASDTQEQAKTFLRGVKNHFEYNDKLKAIFGDYYINAPRWAEHEITVNRRTDYSIREATITTCGTDTALPGRHFDLIIGDDIVSKDNSATPGQRKKVHDWFYETLMPCLDPRGRMWIIGTLWHEECLYVWLQKEDYREAWIHIPVLDENDQSIWEGQFPTERMHRIRRGNLAAFEMQFMCRVGGALGGIFTPDHFTYVDGVYPLDSMFIWQGVDLAAGQKQQNDFFAHATVGIHKETKKPWLLDVHEKKLKFPQQLAFINRQFAEHPRTVRIIIEANAYQIVAAQQLKSDYPELPVMPRWTIKDKTVRANQLSAIVEVGGIHVRRQHDKFVRHLCALPNGTHDDMFDAFDLACRQGLRGARRKRRAEEPGLI
jgi:phage terminase large subunit-like protein